MKLRNKNVLIFGGGSSIGKAIAVRFIKAGAKVMITGRNEEKLKAVAEEIGSPDLYYNVFDITDINFKAAFFLMRNEIDYMKSRRIRGNILNIASNAACMDIIGSYGASKQAIIKWTRAFGKKHGHDGIIINGIAPGATFTPMISRYAKQIDQAYPRCRPGQYRLLL